MSRLLLFFILLQSGLGFSQVIVLDPGHGYCNDSNVRSDTEILTALAVGKKLEVLLNNCPTVTTYFTRETNDCGDFPSLSQRAAMSNSWGADRFLSIHCNAGGGTGTERRDSHKSDSEQETMNVVMRQLGFSKESRRRRYESELSRHT